MLKTLTGAAVAGVMAVSATGAWADDGMEECLAVYGLYKAFAAKTYEAGLQDSPYAWAALFSKFVITDFRARAIVGEAIREHPLSDMLAGGYALSCLGRIELSLMR